MLKTYDYKSLLRPPVAAEERKDRNRTVYIGFFIVIALLQQMY